MTETECKKAVTLKEAKKALDELVVLSIGYAGLCGSECRKRYYRADYKAMVKAFPDLKMPTCRDLQDKYGFNFDVKDKIQSLGEIVYARFLNVAVEKEKRMLMTAEQQSAIGAFGGSLYFE